jgi:hypothetical protein
MSRVFLNARDSRFFTGDPFLWLLIIFILGFLIARLSAQEVEASCRVTCSIEQMANVRVESLECVMDGASPVECLARAKLEHCR